MAQFRASAREGDFAANQVKVPDRVNKIQNEGNRRLQGMSNVQRQLETNQAIFLQAQQQAQGLQSKSKQTISDVNQTSAKNQLDAQALAYEREIKKKNAQDKYKVDTFGALVNFSQTAFKITESIVKANKETQQKAINQIASTNKLSHQDVINAKSINSTVTYAAFQESQLAKKYIKEGKSQDFLKVFHEHLVRGKGYTNYIENAVVMGETGRKHAIILNDKYAELKANGTDPEEIRKQISAIEAELRGTLEIDGQVPSAQIEESSGYNSQMRRALTKIDDNNNRQRNADLEEQITIRESNAIVHAYNNGGVESALKILENVSTPGGPDLVVDVILAQTNVPEEQLNQILDTPITVNGVETTIRTSKPELVKKVNQHLAYKKVEAREQIAAEQQLLVQQGLAAANQVAAEAVDEDGYLSDAELRGVKQAYRNIAGFGTDESVLIGFDRQAGDRQTDALMAEQLEEMRLNKTLTVDMLEMSGASKQVYDQFIGAAQNQDNLRKNPLYKTINSYLQKRIEDSIKGASEIKYNEGGTQSDQFNWFVGEQVKQRRKKVIDLVESGTPFDEALQIVGDIAAKESLKTIQTEGEVNDYQIQSYVKYMSEADQNLLVAQRRLTKWKTLTPTQQADANNWVTSIGLQPLVVASKRLKETGDSQVLEQIGQRVGLTKYQVQHKLAEVSDVIEPIEILQTQQQIQENWSPKQRYSFIADGVTAEQRTRELQQEVNRLKRRNSFQPRGVFQTYTHNGSAGNKLIDLIMSGEGGYDSVNRGVAGDTPGGHPGLSKMTIGEVMDQGYFAVGGPQFIPETFKIAMRDAGLSEQDIFSPQNQRSMAMALVMGTKQPALAAYINGTSDNLDAAHQAIANEWASIQGPSGKGSYDGDSAGNFAHTDGNQVRQLLIQVRNEVSGK